MQMEMKKMDAVGNPHPRRRRKTCVHMLLFAWLPQRGAPCVWPKWTRAVTATLCDALLAGNHKRDAVVAVPGTKCGSGGLVETKRRRPLAAKHKLKATALDPTDQPHTTPLRALLAQLRP